MWFSFALCRKYNSQNTFTIYFIFSQDSPSTHPNILSTLISTEDIIFVHSSWPCQITWYKPQWLYINTTIYISVYRYSVQNVVFELSRYIPLYQTKPNMLCDVALIISSFLKISLHYYTLRLKRGDLKIGRYVIDIFSWICSTFFAWFFGKK